MTPHSGVAWLDATVYLVGSLGFPVAVTIWLLYERYTFGKSVIEAMQALTRAVDRLPDAMREGAGHHPAPPNRY